MTTNTNTDTNNAPARLVYTTTEVAQMLAMERQWIEKLVNAGKIRALPRAPRQRMRIPAAEVDKMMRYGIPTL